MSSTIRYRIHTQNVAPTLVSKHFDGFSIYNVRGFWKGKAESAVVVEIIGSADDRDKVLTLARQIREQYRQEEVWIVQEDISLTRVSIDAITEGL